MALMSSCNSESVNSLLRCAALQNGIDFPAQLHLPNSPSARKPHPPPNWLGLCNPPLSPLSVCVYCKRAVLLAFLCELCVRTSENGLSSGLPRSGPCVGLHYTSPPILCAHSQHLFSNQSWQSSDFWLEILALHPTGGGRDQSSLLPFKYCSFLSSSFSSSFLQIAVTQNISKHCCQSRPRIHLAAYMWSYISKD